MENLPEAPWDIREHLRLVNEYRRYLAKLMVERLEQYLRTEK